MPVSFLEVPKGIHPDAKKKRVQKMRAAVNDVWPIPDVRVFFREYEAANVAQDGVFEVWTPSGSSLGPCTPPSQRPTRASPTARSL